MVNAKSDAARGTSGNDSAVRTGLDVEVSESPGTEVPGYFLCVPNGTQPCGPQKTLFHGSPQEKNDDVQSYESHQRHPCGAWVVALPSVPDCGQAKHE